jgi:hypothetical protein
MDRRVVVEPPQDNPFSEVFVGAMPASPLL